MKKVLAIALALLMALSMFACSTSGSTASPSASAPAATDTAPASETPAATTDSAGFVIPTVDFKATTDPYSRKTYKIINLNIFQSPFTGYMDECYTQLGTKLNYEYSALAFNADIDAFMTGIETSATQGYDGMILQGDFTTQDRIFELVKENNIKFIPGLSPFVDVENNYMMSSVVMDSYDLGSDALMFMVDNYEKYTTKAFAEEEIGFITVTFSVVTDINARVNGALAKYTELYPNLVPTNYFATDTMSAGPTAVTAQAAYDVVAATVAAHPEMKGWIVFGAIEDFAAGASRALEELGKQGSAIVTSNAVTMLMSQWDTGYEGVWVAGIDTPPIQWADATVNGLIALIDGTATPETLWSSLREQGQTYTVIKLPYSLVEIDNYKAYMTASDAYLDAQYPG